MTSLGMPKTSARVCGQPLGLLRRALRLSTVARLVWLLVVVLHTALIARRMAASEWTGALDLARGVLCLGGVVYGSLKFWRVATILDSAPRRALAFALVLILGHWLLAVPSQAADSPGSASRAVVAVLIVAPALVAAIVLAGRASRQVDHWSVSALCPIPVYPARRLPHAAPPRAFFLFRRPPPRFF